MTDIQIGLVVSVVGISITFLALLVFIGVIIALQKLFPAKIEKVDKSYDTVSNAVDISANSDDIDESVVAALAAAIYIRSRRSSQLGATLLTGPGPYRTSR